MHQQKHCKLPMIQKHKCCKPAVLLRILKYIAISVYCSAIKGKNILWIYFLVLSAWFCEKTYAVLERYCQGRIKHDQDSESCSLLQCKELRSRHLHAQGHGVSTMASEFQRIQPLSATAPGEFNVVNEPCLSDCSAELYLSYLRVSKISLKKECSKPACKER